MYGVRIIFAFYVCILCKASWQSRSPGANIHEKRVLRIQGRMSFLEKKSQKALNRVLTLPEYRYRRAESVCICLLKKVFSASSYGRTKVRIEFLTQIHILRFGKTISMYAII